MPFSLASGLTLILGDVKEGSNSPKMASKLMKWKEENQELCNKLNDSFLAKKIWNDLEKKNQDFKDLMECLQALHNENPERYFTIMEKCSELKISSVIF